MEIFGLTSAEAHIYSVLLRIGPNTAGILSKKAGVHRRTAYDLISRLIEKGLISYIVENNRRIFTPVDPENLMTIIKEKEESLRELLPELKKKYTTSITKQETLFFKGKNALKTIFEDQLNTRKEIKVIGASPLAYEMMKYYVHWFNKKREKEKINMKLIYIEKYRKKIPLKFTQVKYLPDSFFNPAAINIYSDKVAIIHWSKDHPFAILINQKEIAQGYENYFNELWKIAKK